MGCRTETFSGWLTKVKSDSAKARWFSGSNKRYFTVNFETQTFYYSHDETNKKVASPIEFFDIMLAEQLPQMSEGHRTLRLMNSKEAEYGFIVRTRDREIRLFSSSWKESRRWVDALNAAGSLGRSQKGLSNGGLKVENSQSQASLSTNEGSGSASSPPSDDGSDSGIKPWQPTSTWNRPTIGGYAQDPWKPAPAGAPPAWAQIGKVLPWASGAEPGSKANAELEFASGVDAFAALDALADELGPVPENEVSPKKVQTASKRSTCKNAWDIAALKNPKMAAAVPPVAPLVVPSSLTPLPSLASLAPIPASFQEAEGNGASTPSKRQSETLQQFSSALGALPGPQQFMISDSPEKDDDAHSWDENAPDDENDVTTADVIAYAAEARGAGVTDDDDPWDSEPDEPSTKSQHRGPSEGQEVDHDSWDNEDAGETKVAKRCGKLSRKKSFETAEEDTSMQDLDDLVGEVLDGQKRVAVHEHLADFHCMQCDNAVICFTGFEWAAEVDYLFIRNFHGKPAKLRPKLCLNSGKTAYCCQCSWKTAASSEALKAVGADLRWRSIS